MLTRPELAEFRDNFFLVHENLLRTAGWTRPPRRRGRPIDPSVAEREERIAVEVWTRRKTTGQAAMDLPGGDTTKNRDRVAKALKRTAERQAKQRPRLVIRPK
jgi:hypothetical protein